MTDTIIDTPGAKTYRVAVLRRTWPKSHPKHGRLTHMYAARIIHASIQHFPETYPYYLRYHEAYVAGFAVVALDAGRAKRAAIRVCKNRRDARLAMGLLRSLAKED